MSYSLYAPAAGVLSGRQEPVFEGGRPPRCSKPFTVHEEAVHAPRELVLALLHHFRRFARVTVSKACSTSRTSRRGLVTSAFVSAPAELLRNRIRHARQIRPLRTGLDDVRDHCARYALGARRAEGVVGLSYSRGGRESLKLAIHLEWSTTDFMAAAGGWPAVGGSTAGEGVVGAGARSGGAREARAGTSRAHASWKLEKGREDGER